jgi:hypothetical protein
MATGDVVFAYRSTNTLNAYYAKGGTEGIVHRAVGVTVDMAVDATAIGGYALAFSDGSNTQKTITWPGRYNISPVKAFTMMMRLKSTYLNTPSARRALLPTLCNGRHPSIELTHALTSGNMEFSLSNEAGATLNTNTSLGVYASPAVGTWTDIGMSFTGDNTANGLKTYTDASLFGSGTAGGNMEIVGTWNNRWLSDIVLGAGRLSNGIFRGNVNEIVIWEGVVDLTANVTLTSGAGLLNGASRTAFVEVPAFGGPFTGSRSRVVNR